MCDWYDAAIYVGRCRLLEAVELPLALGSRVNIERSQARRENVLHVDSRMPRNNAIDCLPNLKLKPSVRELRSKPTVVFERCPVGRFICLAAEFFHCGPQASSNIFGLVHYRHIWLARSPGGRSLRS